MWLLLLVQGPQPVSAGAITEYMRNNLGNLFQNRGKSEPEAEQPTLQTQVSGDNEVKVQPLPTLTASAMLYVSGSC